MNNSVHRHLACPGDSDLDFDLSGAVLTAVVSVDETNELLIRGWAPAGVFDITCQFPGVRDDVWARYVAVLEGWRDECVQLRVTCAPGRLTLLTDEASGGFLPLPRRLGEADRA